MAKFYGEIGYIVTEETRPGVWEEQVTTRNYYGDIERNTRRWTESSEHINDDLNISNEISIVADPYAINHFHAMKYVEFAGAKWKISNVEVRYPRLILSVGGVYNGE